MRLLSQLKWYRLPISAWRRSLHVAARLSPGAESLRVWLHKMRGVKITGRVFIGANVYIDDEHPDRVTIHENCVLGINTIILAHFREIGTVEIGPNAFIGPQCVIMPDVKVGEGSVVAAGSVVTRDVPPFTLVGGSPEAKPLARVTVPLGITTPKAEFQKGLRPLRRKRPTD